MILDLSEIESFGGQLLIPSRDAGLVPCHLWATQRYALAQVATGLEDGIHEFVILAGRQVGKTTFCDLLDLYWPQRHAGTAGMLVSDEDANRDFRRDVLRQMLDSLPRGWKQRGRLDNFGMLAWDNGSRLMFSAASTRRSKSFGRSRGLNYLHADEVGAWPDQTRVAALRAALSKRHPQRLYLWPSTAQGYGVFWEMWKTAQTAVTQKAIFIPPWRHELYRIERSQRAMWERYGEMPATPEERQWLDAVMRIYAYTIPHEYVAWYRATLAEDFAGDETLMAQEYPNLPEDAFQSFGDKFLAPGLVQRLRLDLADAPTPTGYRYEWGANLDESQVLACDPDDAPLLVWEEPNPNGVYVVSAHPSWSSGSGENAAQFVCQVFRAWPDRMVQVAEYAAETGAMYQFAWTCLHLAGAYRTTLPPYFILEIGTTGQHVLQEIQRLEQYGFGLSPSAVKSRDVRDMLGSVRHYLYRRPDTFRASVLLQWKTQPQNRPWVLHELRDEIERRHLTIRSEALIDELAALRRGESGDHDQIEGSGTMHDSRALCAALAVEVWLKQAMPDLRGLLAPKEIEKGTPATVEGQLVGTFLNRLLTTGRTQ